MNVNFSFSPSQIVTQLSRFFHRYHVIVFACVVLGGLSIATLMLYQAITSAEPAAPTATTDTFDTATMKKVDSLHSSSDQVTPLTLPAGRTNPFQ